MPTRDPNQGSQTESPQAQTPPDAIPERLASEAVLERFAKSFEASARRWELVVYPSLFAFIILAAYGFFLIYSLTRDMHTLAASIDPSMSPHMDTMANNMVTLSKNIASMTATIDKMARKVENMDASVENMNGHIAAMATDLDHVAEEMNTMEPMLVNMAEMNKAIHGMNQSVLGMNQAVQSMNVNTGAMSRDMATGTYHFVRPMSFMNSFLPW